MTGLEWGREERGLACFSLAVQPQVNSFSELQTQPHTEEAGSSYALGGQAEQGRGHRKPLLLATEASHGTEAGEREERITGPGECKRAARCVCYALPGVTQIQVPIAGFSPNIYAEYGGSRGSWI